MSMLHQKLPIIIQSDCKFSVFYPLSRYVPTKYLKKHTKYVNISLSCAREGFQKIV